jgi:hypothetical protein
VNWLPGIPGYPGWIIRPVDIDDHGSAETRYAPLDEPNADRHPQPDPVGVACVVRMQPGGQRPDQHGEHDGGIDVGGQDRVDPVPGPLMVDDPRIELQPALREHRHHQLPEALLHVVPVGDRARAVSRDIEHKSHS